MSLQKYLLSCRSLLGSHGSVMSVTRMLSSIPNSPSFNSSSSLEGSLQFCQIDNQFNCSTKLQLEFSQFSPKADHQYQCPSRLSQLFSNLIIMDTHLDKNLLYDCPMSSGLNKQPVIAPHVRDTEIAEPPVDSSADKFAVNMLRIRARKMRKHKLKKLRKRMFFQWKKTKEARKKRLNAAFEKELDVVKKTGDDFDPRDFVLQQLEKAREGGYKIDILDSKSKHA